MFNIFNIQLDSDLQFPELTKIENNNEIIKITSGKNSSLTEPHLNWIQDIEDSNGELCLSIAKYNRGYVLRFPELADFVITEDLDEIIYFSDTTLPKVTLRHLILDQVIPRLLTQKGNLILHASAVKLLNNKVFLFLGDTGWGKSTLASTLYADGAELISDDCILLNHKDGDVFCISNYNGIRIFEDSLKVIFPLKSNVSAVAHYTEKKRIKLKRNELNQSQNFYKVDGIYLLNDPKISLKNDEICRVSENGINKFLFFLEKTFVLDHTDNKNKQFLLFAITDIVNTNLPCYVLAFPRKFKFLSKVSAFLNQI